MKQYFFSLVIDEGQDEFWDEKPSNKRVKDLVATALSCYGFNPKYNCALTLEKVNAVTGKKVKTMWRRGMK